MLKPFFIRHNKLLKSIDPAQVVALYTEGNYTRIFMKDETFYMVRSSLTRALKKLPPEIFIRIHKSIVASIYYIDDIDKDHLIICGEPMPIGKQYYKSFISRLNIIE
jgi:DNA-binding LytR/AlgR family response regulator